MGIFNDFYDKYGVSPFTLGIPGSFFAPSFLKKDPRIEGKKAGYKRAAEEYEPICNRLEEEYIILKDILEIKIEKVDSKLMKLISYLQEIEDEKKIYEKILSQKRREINLESEMTVGMTGMLVSYGIIKKIYEHKFNKAEIEGYEEARELYERKISDLKDKIEELQHSSKIVIENHENLVAKTLSSIAENMVDIAKIRFSIADLNLLQ